MVNVFRSLFKIRNSVQYEWNKSRFFTSHSFQIYVCYIELLMNIMQNLNFNQLHFKRKKFIRFPTAWYVWRVIFHHEKCIRFQLFEILSYIFNPDNWQVCKFCSNKTRNFESHTSFNSKNRRFIQFSLSTYQLNWRTNPWRYTNQSKWVSDRKKTIYKFCWKFVT